MSDVPKHRAQPQVINVTEWAYTLVYRCLFCDKPVQRRGLLRRWRHVH